MTDPSATTASPTPPSRTDPSFGAGSVADHFAREQLALRAGRPAALVSLVGPLEVVLSVGVGVTDAAAYLGAARASNVRTIRRSTGGTGVLHGADDLLWSLVLPREDRRVGRDFVRAYARLGAPVVAALAAVGVAASWEPAPGLSEEYCPLGGRGRVLVSGETILGGAAQHATREALLHHGAVAWSVDRPRVLELFRATPRAAVARLGGVADLAPGIVPPRLAEHLRSALGAFANAGRER